MYSFGNSTTYYSSKTEWATYATSTGRIDKVWSQYNQNSDFQWCNYHKRLFVPTDQAPTNGFEQECSVCRKSEPLLNINGGSDEKTIATYRVMWQNCKKKLKEILYQIKESNTADKTGNISIPMLAREEIGCWLQYEISVWNLAQALKQYYFTLYLEKKLPAANKWRLNETISNYQSDYLVRASAISSPTGTLASRSEKGKVDRALLTTPGITYCSKHDCIGEGIPLKHPNRYNPECFTCVEKRPITEEQKQRNAPVKMVVRDVKGDNVEIARTMNQFVDESIPCIGMRRSKPVTANTENKINFGPRPKSDKVQRAEFERTLSEPSFTSNSTFNFNNNSNSNMEDDNIPFNHLTLYNKDNNPNQKRSNLTSVKKDYRALPSNPNGGLPIRNKTTVKRLAPGQLFL